MQSNQRHVLVAEDNAALGYVVTFVLERAGFHVTRVASGTEAWQAAQEVTFSLVVTDHQMPGMSGRELCERLRSLPRYQDVPIMMLTAKRFELDAAGLRDQLGISHVFAKPFSPALLLAAVQEQFAATS